MANIKTAVSIEEGLFKQAEQIGRELKISRSRLFAVALKDFVERRRNRALLETINEAYPAPPNDDDRRYLGQMRRHHRKLIDRW